VVVDFIDRMGLSRATLVAHDWGGPIGLHAAAQRPDNFERLVPANTWAGPMKGDLAQSRNHRGIPLGEYAAIDHAGLPVKYSGFI
jgi:haloalkane dehalogenase